MKDKQADMSDLVSKREKNKLGHPHFLYQGQQITKNRPKGRWPTLVLHQQNSPEW